MKFTWKTDQRDIDWNELSDLYTIAPLGNKEPDKLKVVFSNSLYKYFIYDGNKLIGAGRCLADGCDCAYICDIAIHPDYQNYGLGSAMMNKLLHDVEGYEKIILYAVPGKETFYSKFKFRKMKTAMAIYKNQDHAVKVGLVE